MKTSRIIFISFFTVFGMLLLSMLIVGFAYNDKDHSEIRKKEFEEKFNTEKIDIEQFSHIVFSKDCKFTVEKAKNASVTFTELKAEASIKPKYKIENDTLFLQSSRTNMGSQLNIQTANLVSLRGAKGDIHLRGFNQDAFTAHLSASKLRMNNNVTINRLTLDISDKTQVDAWNIATQHLDLKIDDSTYRGRCKKKLESVKSVLTGNSNAQLPQAKKYDLDVAKSSKIQIQ